MFMENLIEFEENEFLLNKTLSLENKLLDEFEKVEKV